MYVHVHVHMYIHRVLFLQGVEKAWSKKYLEFKEHWAHLSAAIKGSAIEPIEVDCTAELEQMERSTVMDLEGRQHLQYIYDNIT